MRSPLTYKSAPGTARYKVLLAGAVVSGLVGLVACHRVATGGQLLDQGWSVMALLAFWWLAFGVGAAALLRLPTRTALVALFVVAAALRLSALAGPSVLSDDLYRYAWDSRVQAADVNPYRYAPTAPELADLREPWLWPGPAACAELDREPGCTRINRDRDPTIYPPLAQVWFRAVAGLLPPQARDGGWQATAGLVDLGLVGMLVAFLRALGRDPRYAVLYAWSPIAVLETAQSAHIDGLAVVGIVGALWAAHRGRSAVAGGLLGAATLLKLYPAVLLPVLLRRHPLRAIAAFGAVVVGGYVPHLLAVGSKVLGYLPGYLAEERYASGSRFLLLGLAGLTGQAAQAVAVVVMALAAWAAWRSVPVGGADAGARRLLGVLLLVVTPVQPWYALALVAMVALGAAWWWLAVAAAGYPVYLAAVLGDGRSEGVGRLSYGLAFLIVAAFAWRAHRHASLTRIDTDPLRSGDGTWPRPNRWARPSPGVR